MVPSHRQALRACLLSFRCMDGIYLQLLLATHGVARDKVMAGGTPANPATLVSEELT